MNAEFKYNGDGLLESATRLTFSSAMPGNMKPGARLWFNHEREDRRWWQVFKGRYVVVFKPNRTEVAARRYNLLDWCADVGASAIRWLRNRFE